MGMERMLQLILVALGVGCVYRFRFLVTIQKPWNGSQMWGYVTIPQTEQWNVSMTNGRLRTVTGPDVVIVWGATFWQLQQYSASSAQYLLIQFLDGRSEIAPGPAHIFMDSSIHKDVRVKDATNLTDAEVLVVYRDDHANLPKAERGTGLVTRHIIHGPCLHVPKNASEWTHQFCWHGSPPYVNGHGAQDVDNSGRKLKGAIKFTKLRVSPDQTYFDVEGVRTKDDALVCVKVMIFFRLTDINVMLKETHDPIADFINSVSSDVIEFVAGKSFEEFKAATDQLNMLEMYRSLTSRAKGIGFEVTKVVFRGYGAPQQLQKMHDDAIQRRTKLALEQNQALQEQQLQDMKLQHESDRDRKRRQMEMEAKEHEHKLQRAAHEATQKEDFEKRQAMVDYLDNMRKTLGLSGEALATYLTAYEQGPPAKVVQIITGKDGCASDRNSFVIQDTA